jgi:hypothetical protein
MTELKEKIPSRYRTDITIQNAEMILSMPDLEESMQ